MSILLPLLLAAAAAVPQTNIISVWQPHTAGVQPSCAPGVTAAGNVFGCYKTQSRYYAVAMLSDTTTVLVSTTSSPFVKQPLVVSDTAVAFYDTLPTNSMYFIAGTTWVEPSISRHGVQAGLAVSATTNYVLVPLGLADKGGYNDDLQAIVVGSTGVKDVAFNTKLTTKPDVTGTAVSTPVPWNDNTIIMVEQTLQLINFTGQIVKSLPNPCGLTFTTVSGVELIRTMWHGMAIAMIMIHGNSTTTSPQYSFCSIHPSDFSVNWHVPYPDSIVVHDITAGGDTALVSGTINGGAFTTWSIKLTTGSHHKVITRQGTDFFSWPAFLPRGISNCNGTFIMQHVGQITAFCTDTMQPIWIRDYGCSRRPMIDINANRVVCIEWGAAVSMLDFDGTVIWYDNRIAAEFEPTLIDPVVYVMDGQARMYRLSYDPAPETSTPPPSGLSGGEVFLIVFGIFVISGSILGAVYYYKRASYRVARPARIDSDGYGSLTS